MAAAKHQPKAPQEKHEAPRNLAPEPTREEPKPVEPAPKSKSPHATLCRVTGGSCVSGGKLFPEGFEGEFPDADVLSLPDTLVPLE